MRVLVTWGTRRGGTAGIARVVGDTLRAASRAADDGMRQQGGLYVR